MKTIKEIARNANFNCKIDRHGIYTDYTLTRGNRKLYIEFTSPKNGCSHYSFSANGPIENTTNGNYIYEYQDGPGYQGVTHIIANGNFAAKLTLEEIETLVYNN